jgi:hypothetical protein
VKVVGDDATLQSSTTCFNKTITKLDVISIQEDCKMLTQLWRFHNLFEFVKTLNGKTCAWLGSIIHCCCLCLIKHPIPFIKRLDITKNKINCKQQDSCKT